MPQKYQAIRKIKPNTQKWMLEQLDIVANTFPEDHSDIEERRNGLQHMRQLVLEGNHKRIYADPSLRELLKTQQSVALTEIKEEEEEKKEEEEKEKGEEKEKEEEKKEEKEEEKEEEGNILSSSSTRYIVLEMVGSGSFGHVYRCQNETTKEEVAVKVFKQTIEQCDVDYEVLMLEQIRILIPGSSFMMKLFERFEYKGWSCLVFEMLDNNLTNVVECPEVKPLTLGLIRPIAKQLFMALNELKAANILHADIKPDNIMFVDRKHQPHRVKLVDFGWAMTETDVWCGLICQAPSYRAPEVYLGLPFTEAIDVWGVACTLAFLYLGQDLINASSEYEMIKLVFKLVGQPEDHLLRAGKYTQQIFIEDETADGSTWRMAEECTEANLLSSLEDLVNVYPTDGDAEFEDRIAFGDLLKQLLHVDGNKRMSANQALQHPFITMDHLIRHPDNRAYLEASQAVMNECPVFSADSLYSSEDYRSSQESSNGVYDDDGLTTGSSDECPVTDSGNEDPVACYSDGVVPPVSDEEHPDVCSSDGGQHQCSKDEDLTAKSFEGATPTEITPDVPASSGRMRKFLKRISRIFRGVKNSLCCCLHPNVED